mmetsp:Transcript_45120/g.134741  ORF Transcript_45120/g.134741 Transcript_45120/m.134741 type:complete len:97 (-) Transcript_45120:487-777(-)|eukprot:200537-Chlamydomonas_euryale.AAC.6
MCDSLGPRHLRPPASLCSSCSGQAANVQAGCAAAKRLCWWLDMCGTQRGAVQIDCSVNLRYVDEAMDRPDRHPSCMLWVLSECVLTNAAGLSLHLT